ncbi:endolytic transglycosylase MltG [Candidatus Uhrbacteria bacterium]|nr:endolytic transglycosylase MltG [Candidatus Uhrbacteria bacterium]
MEEFIKPQRAATFGGALVAIGVGVLFLLVVAALWLSYILFQPVVLTAEHSVSVAKGETISSIADRLKDEGIIRSAHAFRLLVSLRYAGETMKAGDYTLSGSPTLAQTALLFMSGAPNSEFTITVIEGWTVADIARTLEDVGALSSRDFLAAAQEDYTGLFPFLPPQSRTQSLEGYLFPDTYRLFKKSAGRDMIERMLENFAEKYTADMVAETLAQKRDVHAIVTLASLLEREVQGDRDRRMVADIFYRRLEKGMPLQADSTINYITGKKDARARLTDLEIVSPYNTYRNKGLPSGPIGNPGLSSLQAALSPIKNPFWFFLTTPDGEVIYSKTFEEHVKNKLKYLKK